MSKKAVAVGLSVCFAAGVAVGHFCLGRCVQAVDHPATAPVKAGVPGVGRELDAAHRRIAVLERRLASLSARLKATVSAKATNDVAETTIDGLQTNLYEELERKLPAEEYRQVTNAFERMKLARTKRVQGKLAFLSSIDTSGLTADEQRNHEEYVKLVTLQDELMGKAKGIIPDAKTLEQLLALQMKTKPLADAERRLLLRQMSANLGYSGEDAAVVVGTVEDIVGATSAGGFGAAMGAIVEDLGGAGGDGQSVEIKTQILTP